MDAVGRGRRGWRGEHMRVGETYEVHWPHSAAGACGTPNQYQSPFYDGVFCRDGIITLDPLNTHETIGVQAQVFTLVNDETHYYPNMIQGMIVAATLPNIRAQRRDACFFEMKARGPENVHNCQWL